MNWTKDQLMERLAKNPALKCRQDLSQLPDDDPELKYRNQPGYYDDIYFDSQAEINRYCELKLLKRAGVIARFEVHPRFRISPRKYYEADFQVWYADGHVEVEDVKGFLTSRCALAIDAFREKYPDLQLVIIDA